MYLPTHNPEFWCQLGCKCVGENEHRQVSLSENNPITNPTACVKHSTDTFDTVHLSLTGVMVELLLVELRFWRLLCIEMFFPPSLFTPSLTADIWTRTDRRGDRGAVQRRQGEWRGTVRNEKVITPHLVAGRRHQKTLDLNEFWLALRAAHQYSRRR